VIFHNRILRRPLIKTGGAVVSLVIIPGYKVYLFAKKRLAVAYHPTGNKFWDIVTSRYIIHAIIIIIGLAVTGNNIRAQVVGFRDENYGHQTMLYALVGGDELGLTEETSDNTIDMPPVDYLDFQAGIKSAPAATTPEEAMIAIGDEAILTQGGSALIRPDISNMAEPTGTGRTEREAYIVQEGDTLASIAAKFGISVNTILWENNLTEKSYIRPGQQLTILPATGVNHKVKRGETLASIARQYGVEPAVIIVYNDLLDEDTMQIGQELFIPGGKKAPAYVKPPAARVVQSYVGSPPAGSIPSSTRLQWPTSGRAVTQYYSWRHTGLDIDGNLSSPIYAAEAGTVIRAQVSGYNGGYGENIIIDHGNGMQTLYGHLSKLFVGVGETVTRGQTIGMMGNTGRSTGSHLHFEVRVNGARLNSLTYIR
jgi:murein DD-endopeptidase MepM/ murein hydrolase activator NlpD